MDLYKQKALSYSGPETVNVTCMFLSRISVLEKHGVIGKQNEWFSMGPANKCLLLYNITNTEE